jgi:hypothetical protein
MGRLKADCLIWLWSKIPVLSLGLVLAGAPSDRLVWDRMNELGTRIEAAREDISGAAKVNVVFYAPGPMLELDFTELRTARLSRSSGRALGVSPDGSTVFVTATASERGTATTSSRWRTASPDRRVSSKRYARPYRTRNIL